VRIEFDPIRIDSASNVPILDMVFVEKASYTIIEPVTDVPPCTVNPCASTEPPYVKGNACIKRADESTVIDA
jgi:uncharacterized membrane protein (UPF0127 family)